MNNSNRENNFWASNWLVILIAAQPVLDVLAYLNQNSAATISGYIRLIIMIALPVYLLFTLKRKKGLLISMGLICLFGLAHMLNCFRTGYIDPIYDAAYYARVMQMPVLTVCFIFLIRDEKTKKQAYRGIIIAALIMLSTVIISAATGTFTYTYPEGIGISGWVIDDNRCANSILLVSLSVFAVGMTALSDNKAAHILVPCTVTAVLILNGTKACYAGLFAILLGYACFMVFARIVRKDRIKKVLLAALIISSAAAVIVYPVSPRARIDDEQGRGASEIQLKFEAELREKGYDIYSMSLEEKLADEELKDMFHDYYVKMLGVLPDLYERFGMDRVYEKYKMTTDAATLIDVRIMKTTYASLIWDECDALTKFFGFETSETVRNGMYDMENDYPAVFYYYGYAGFGLCCLFLLYFVYLIIKRLAADFRGNLTTENFMLLLCLLLQLGLAQFSGAVFRRPNVSVYLSLVLALIYYQTRILPVKKSEEAV